MAQDPWYDGTAQRWHRRAAGLSGAALAREVGCSHQHLSGIESGQWQPSEALAAAIAKALRVKLSDLMIPVKENAR